MITDSCLIPPHLDYLESHYQNYLANSAALDPEWKSLFDSLGIDQPSLTVSDVRPAILDSLRALMLIRVYRVRGHLNARLDPLNLQTDDPHPELDPAYYGFTPQDYNRPIFLNYSLGVESATLAEIVDILTKTYSEHIGVEFLHIQDPEQKNWIQQRIEQPRNQTEFTPKGKQAILERIIEATLFEDYLDKKYKGTKRFGLEGGESLLPALEQILKRGGQLGLKEVVIGMAHRGRLNVLVNVMKKPMIAIFSEFQGNSPHPEGALGSGDVKYHSGTSSDRTFDDTSIHLSLTANPSHLEVVNPVVLGKVRAKQEKNYASSQEAVSGLLIHGDAAFAGQGIVSETLLLSTLQGYTTGGTIHIIVNNQIGFTTNPIQSRPGKHPTDIAQMIQAPIFHVNGDDPEAVVHVARIAIEFRQRFKKDVIIDMVCYRRAGHNEGDEPFFTQPLMYQKIKTHPKVHDIYAQKLIKNRVIAQEEIETFQQAYLQELQYAYDNKETYRPNRIEWLEDAWSGLSTHHQDETLTIHQNIASAVDDVAVVLTPTNPSPNEQSPTLQQDITDTIGQTAVPLTTLKRIGAALYSIPPKFHIHRTLERQLGEKHLMFENESGINWGTAEALAFGSLLLENLSVRLSGQDSGRGTFSHRHAIWYDQKTQDPYIPLRHLSDSQGIFDIYDSPLSEMGVLGFEYGYSLANPHILILWEAQFGDFANGAQVIIDQFLAAAESKWLRLSGLVLLLPHGYEGQGPEHSSARPERFLQLCAESNIQVVNCTTPANYFHVLRRQLHRTFRKPLIVFSPKSLVRHKECVSTLSELSGESAFHRILDDPLFFQKDKSGVKRLILCSGKIYYDLLEARGESNHIALIRIEQLYPFPFTSLSKAIQQYPETCQVYWCQEEPRNMGAWYFIDHRLETILRNLQRSTPRARYIGRPEAASPATGSYRHHQIEQKSLLSTALSNP